MNQRQTDYEYQFQIPIPSGSKQRGPTLSRVSEEVTESKANQYDRDLRKSQTDARER